MKKLGTVLLHAVMLAIVCAIAAYWGVKLLTPPPSAAPPPVAATPPRDPDPVLAARMFGLVQAPSQTVSNIQIGGVFAAGKDSAAILIVDGKPARVFLIGQDVAPGLKLVDVRPEGVSLESSSGARQELQLPLRQVATLSGDGPPPPPAFTIENNTLTAPSQPASAAPPPTPAPRPPPQVPQSPPPQQPPQQQQLPAQQQFQQGQFAPPNAAGAGGVDTPVQGSRPPQAGAQPPQGQPAQGPRPPRPPPGTGRRTPPTR